MDDKKSLKVKILISGDGSKTKALIKAIINGDIQVVIPDEINKSVERLMKDRKLLDKIDIKKETK